MHGRDVAENSDVGADCSAGRRQAQCAPDFLYALTTFSKASRARNGRVKVVAAVEPLNVALFLLRSPLLLLNRFTDAIPGLLGLGPLLVALHNRIARRLGLPSASGLQHGDEPNCPDRHFKLRSAHDMNPIVVTISGWPPEPISSVRISALYPATESGTRLRRDTHSAAQDCTRRRGVRSGCCGMGPATHRTASVSLSIVHLQENEGLLM